MLFGYLSAFGSAFFESLVDVARKRSGAEFSKWTAAWGRHAMCAPILLVVAMVIHPHTFPHSGMFWVATAGSAVINLVASVLYMEALQTAPMSLVLPLVTLSPVFLLATSPIINREFPSILGTVGILVTTAGTYALNFDRAKQGWFEPIRLLWKEKGTRSMLIVAMLWSVSAPLDKLAIRHADPFWYSALINIILGFMLLPFVIRAGESKKIMSARGMLLLLPLGISSALATLTQFVAFSRIMVPYAIGIKRTSVLWGVAWGRTIFKEEKIGMRFGAALLMCLGAIFILFAGK
ncbi:MAG: DMT family transporter [Patescibacteria group bacterium]